MSLPTACEDDVEEKQSQKQDQERKTNMRQTTFEEEKAELTKQVEALSASLDRQKEKTAEYLRYYEEISGWTWVPPDGEDEGYWQHPEGEEEEGQHANDDDTPVARTGGGRRVRRRTLY